MRLRVPLRPLASVIATREHGGDPDTAEVRRRAEALRAARMRERRRAGSRLALVSVVFLVAFSVLALRMGDLALSGEADGGDVAARAPDLPARADIVDRRGTILATTLPTASVYVETRHMVDPGAVARGLAGIFPDIDAGALEARFDGPSNFHWIRDQISPEEQQAVFDLGQPGVFFGARDMRVYPQGRRLGHVLGGARYGEAGHEGAEIIGTAGVEHMFDTRLSDTEQIHDPLRLSVDLRVQSAMREVLAAEMARFEAIGASGILMDAKTGEVVSLVSLPDFDPNARPVAGRAEADTVLMNRAAQGVYELGSVFKPLQVALALEEGVVTPETMVDTRGPLFWAGRRIRDVHRMDPQMTVSDVVMRSSNVGTARIAMLSGVEAQQAFLRGLGLLDASNIELPEARMTRPLVPSRWTELSMLTISYGHGLSISPMHLAAAYGAIANGGRLVQPTLLSGGRDGTEGSRVMSPATAGEVRRMLRRVVEEEPGTANFAEVAGFEVAGKTGTADKPIAGGYATDRVIATFASFFPASNPAYVMVITLDEPTDRSGPEPRRSAGWTAAPASANVLRRIAPILGLRPEVRGAPESSVAPLLVRLR